jgi:type I restriction enzyme S subunit
MEVKLGYKQTELGLIPDDWSLRRLGDVSDLDIGLSKPKIVFGSGCPVVTVQDLYAGSIINSSSLKRVVVTEDEIRSYRLEKDDILIGNASVKRDGIGYSNRFDGSNEDVIFAKYAYRARSNRAIFPLFLHHALRASFCRQWIISNSQTGTLTNLNKVAAKAIPIPLPCTLSEQRAIAAALSDVDALLDGLEQLIAKKRDLKQAAMQQLLTGQTRLPGFSGEWEDSPLRRFVKQFIVPMRDKPRRLIGDIPWCRIEDFDGIYLSSSKSGQCVDADTVRDMNLKIYPTGTLLVSCSADLGRCAIVAQPLVSNQTFIGLVMDANVSSNVFFYYLMTSMAEDLNNLSTGTTISYLSREQFEEFVVHVPIDPHEQTAIAAILSDMDAELSALESRRDKTRALKQAMMQELLTGRIRLV